MENPSSARLRVTQVPDLAAFTAAARPFFEVDEARSTIALTILAGLESGVHRDGRLYRVDADDAPVLFAMRTPPFAIVVARGEPEPLGALARFVADADPELPGVTGPTELARVFASAAGRPVAEEKAMRLYTCRAVAAPPRPPEGRARRAETRDLDQMVAWYDAFSRDVKTPLMPARPTIERAIADGRLFVWEAGGALVSMTQRTAIAGRCARVNLVYTPPEQRGHGFASGLVAHVTGVVLAEAPGAYACLFTDLGNPTSNAIYQSIGYVPVGDYAEIRFRARAASVEPG